MSTRILVNDFSCISNADLEISSLTVLIGPSASGKSILSKLIFFFNDLLNDQWQVLEDGKGIDTFKGFVKDKFKEWFPVEAWGEGKFQIEFYCGDFQVRVSRIEYRKKLGDNMRVWLSPFFEEQYERALSALKEASRITDQSMMDHRYMRANYSLQEKLRKVNKRRLGDDHVDIQTFVPAGRSFFTSIGKSIAVFEHSRILDPLILRFGRFYAGVRENRLISHHKMPAAFSSHLDSLLNGSVVFERNKEYLRTSDGRRVPFSAMSSGQQELMPLILALKRRAIMLEVSDVQQMLFIEEPEAHLFPAAQSDLVEAFVQFLSMSRGRAKMLVTTHSPYVLAKLNNLMKAKEVAGRKGSKKSQLVQDIVREEYWLAGEGLRAYAIKDGKLERIQDESDNLIEADYLDEVSGSISNEFSRLLGVEYSK
ncbi:MULTISPECIES: ATP-binding protein [unclassified Stenotrophomonas]|uniref:ATP-binding protein n=1 Tax=unclassified Stenotrophomonas TaxID=196198 RepID=UPI003012EDE3